MKNLALVAHDHLKDQLVEFVRENISFFKDCNIYSTGTTAQRIKSKIPELTINAVKSGPLGGDLQIGSMIVEDKIEALIFFWDPLSPQPHDVDVKALLRISVLKNIYLASNLNSARALVKALQCK